MHKREKHLTEEARFDGFLGFISSAGPEELRGLDYPILLDRYGLSLQYAEERLQTLFGMSGFEIVDLFRTGETIRDALTGETLRDSLTDSCP